MTVSSAQKLIIVGVGEFGAMACEYFSDDSIYQVCGFAVEARYRQADEFMGLPVEDFETIEDRFPPDEYDVFVAVTYVSLNAERKRLLTECCNRGYRVASFVSSSSFIGRNAEVLAGAFVMEGCSLQRRVKVGSGAVIWNGCNIAHQTVIEDFAWVAPGVSMGGFSRIGSQCFVGVGASIGDHAVIPSKNVIGAGSVVTKSVTEGDSVFAGNPLVRLDSKIYARFTDK